jgi:uncharacterized protein (TIGR00251 family)
MIRATSVGVCLQLHIQPGASKTEVVGLHGDRIKIRLAAAPVAGEANEALVRWLAQKLEVATRAVTILRGSSSRQKSVEIVGVDEKIVRRLLDLLPTA